MITLSCTLFSSMQTSSTLIRIAPCRTPLTDRIACNWLAAGRSVAGTARILQLSFDPAKRLLRESLHVLASTVLNQLREGCGKQFGSATVGIAFEFVPIAIANAQVLVKIPGLFKGLFGPVRRRHVVISSALSHYRDR